MEDKSLLLALLVLAIFYGIYKYSRNPAFLGFDFIKDNPAARLDYIKNIIF